MAPTRPAIERRNTGTGASSLNWSGYAQGAPRNTFTAVTADFVVTTVNTHVSGTQYSSDWVGIGGLTKANLVQAGIEEDNIQGRAVYQAWTEILPQSEDPLSSLTISPGDKIAVTVRETANKHNKDKQWSMTVDDVSTGLSASRVVRYKAKNTSVEAIHERPCLGSPCISHLATLATTTNESFVPAYFSTSAPSLAPTYRPLLTPASGATLYDMVMITNSGAVLATPSNANTANDGFTVGDGSTVPAPPPS